MIAAAHPEQERRLAALQRYGILDTAPEKDYDEIVKLVAMICDAPIAVVNLIDADRQWFKAEVGLGVRSTPLDTSLCSHVILEGEFVEIPDTLADPRMRDNPLCAAGDGALRFYAGATLLSDDGLPIGTLCVLDTKPRKLDDQQREALRALAGQVMRLLELRLALHRQQVLLMEIDHRVKNSLAAISAVIGLQTARSDNSEVRQALDGVRSRLAALIALHEELHSIGAAETIDLARYLERIVRLSKPLLPEGIAMTLDAEALVLTTDRASSIGLIVNEFLANAGKYAFALGRVGTITIRGRHEGADYRLRCADDGAADAAALAAIARKAGLGTRIIAASAAGLPGTSKWTLAEPGLVLDVVFAS